MAKNEHKFTLDEFRKMWLHADLEGKARLSTALSLGWSVKDFLILKTTFIRQQLEHLDPDGYACFDAERGKTQARVRAILNPDAIRDLRNYLSSVPTDQQWLWSVRTGQGLNWWIKHLAKQAGVNDG